MNHPESGTPARVSVRLEGEGGLAHIPGLSRPVEVDTSDLDPADADVVRALLARSGFFGRHPDPAEPPPGAADYRTWTITATAGGRSHTIRLVEPIEDPALRELVDWLRARRRRAH